MPKKDEKDEKIANHPRVVAREAPNSYEAECAVLGAVIVDGDTAIKYIPELDENDFYTPANKLIFSGVKALFLNAKPIDFVTTVQEMTTQGTVEMAGGASYISKLVDELPTLSNCEYYFNIVKKMTKLRSMIAVAQKMADEAYALDPDDNALSHAEATLYDLGENDRHGKPENVTKYIDLALQDIKQRQDNADAYKGVPTGFKHLNQKLGGGFQNSDLIVLAARPGQGKTSFAMNCAVNAALNIRPDTKKHYVVAVFSLEMSAVQLAKRILCSQGGVSMTISTIGKPQWAKLYAAQDRFAGTNLYIDESGDVTPAEILSKCRQLKHTVGLDFVLIDYLQLMQSGKRIDNIVREIAEITRSLKLAAKELNIPILLLSQMSRDIDKRKDPRPQLSDLRDSGAIEQDADIVLFLDRQPKKEDGPTDKNTVYLNIEKHRNGETGSIKLQWQPESVTFKEVDKNMQEPSTKKDGVAYSDDKAANGDKYSDGNYGEDVGL